MLLEDDIHEQYKALKAILKDNLLLEKDNIFSIIWTRSVIIHFLLYKNKKNIKNVKINVKYMEHKKRILQTWFDSEMCCFDMT